MQKSYYLLRVSPPPLGLRRVGDNALHHTRAVSARAFSRKVRASPAVEPQQWKQQRAEMGAAVLYWSGREIRRLVEFIRYPRLGILLLISGGRVRYCKAEGHHSRFASSLCFHCPETFFSGLVSDSVGTNARSLCYIEFFLSHGNIQNRLFVSATENNYRISMLGFFYWSDLN